MCNRPALADVQQDGPLVNRTSGYGAAVRLPVLGVPISAVDWNEALAALHTWVRARESRYVCICNAHSVVMAGQNALFRRAIEAADMATPDGAPVAWMLRQLGQRQQQRINGPDLMWRYCAQVAGTDASVYLYGSTPDTLQRLRQQLHAAFPSLVIAGMRSPPFRPLSADEDAADVAAINASGAGLVWVSLGCPKQELWMAAHAGRVQAVMVGVGAAFDFHAGTVARAPAWMRTHGLEWLHRFASEPRRLWRRYLITNTLFVWGAARQLLGRAIAR